MAELEEHTNEDLLAMPDSDRMVPIAGRSVRELVWVDRERGEPRLIVQHYDRGLAMIWASGMVLHTDGGRRRLTEIEIREYA